MYVMAPVVANALAPAAVKTESWPGTGVTKSFVFGWVTMARLQAQTIAPRATVVSIGAGDIYPLRVAGRFVGCCSRAWIAAYADRIRTMNDAYARGGAGRVYWVTLPRPGNAGLARFNAAVNRAVMRAEGGEVIDLRPAITPHGRYRRTVVTPSGRRLVLRQLDGVHLGRDGRAIAARVIRARLVRDGVLGPDDV